MMRTILALIFFSIVALGCNRKSRAASAEAVSAETPVPHSSIPACVQQRIDSIKQLRVWNPPAEVSEYEYKGEKVYGFSADCCDMFYTIVNAECGYICAPSGGFTGKGDGRCNDFNQNAKLIRVVWKDERAKKQ